MSVENNNNNNTQITPLDVVILGIYKAQSRGAFNLNEASILAKAVQYFTQKQMLNPSVLQQINNQESFLNSVQEQCFNNQPTNNQPINNQPINNQVNQKEDNKKVSITDDDLSDIYVIGGNKGKKTKTNLRMVIEDDE